MLEETYVYDILDFIKSYFKHNLIKLCLLFGKFIHKVGGWGGYILVFCELCF